MKAMFSLLFITLMTIGSCKKDDKGFDGGAAVVEATDDRVVFTVDPSIEQSASAPAASNIASSSVTFPAGTFSEAIEITMKEGTSLANNYLHKIYTLDAEHAVSASAAAVELRPSSTVVPTAAYTLTIPKPTEGSGHLTVLYKGVNEDGIWPWGLIAPSQVTENDSTVTIKPTYLGRFQAVYLDTEITEDISSKDAGAGPWYGYEFDLYSEFAAPEADSPDHVFALYTGLGLIDEFYINGTALIPPPGFSFPDLMTDDPKVFDGSDSTVVAPAIFSSDFDYGVQLEARTREEQITSRILQRSITEVLPTEALVWSDFAGSFTGTSSQMGTTGVGSYSVSASYNDEILIEEIDGSLSLTGTFTQKTLTGTLQGVAGSTATTLGLLSGTVDIEGQSYNAYGFVSPDHKALGLLLCPTSGSCPVGDGTGVYAADEFMLSIFVKEP